MSKFDKPLNNLKIASPCSADWNEMYGDNRKRFCGDCKLNVYNLSGMTRDEAESLIRTSEGRLCVRYYSRADGSVITADCPVGWARVKQRTKVVATAVFSMLMALFTGVFIVSLFSRGSSTIGVLKAPFVKPTPEHTMGVMAMNTNTSIPPPSNRVVMGDVTPNVPRHQPEPMMGKVAVTPSRDH